MMPDRKRLSSIAILIGLASLLIGICLILALGVTVISDYQDEKQYTRTECTVRAVEFNNENPKNEWTKCPWTCTLNYTPDGWKTYCEISDFPCLKIIVDVKTKYGLKSAIIHENPDKMKAYEECSTYHCDRDSVVNEKIVNKFKRSYGKIGSKYTCFYNMESLERDDDEEQEHALLKLTYSQASYINSIFWPTLIGTFGLTMLIYGIVEKIRLNRAKSKTRLEQYEQED